MSEAEELVADLQTRICARACALEGREAFAVDDWTSAGSGGAVAGRGSTRVIERGDVFERAGVNTSFVRGAALPPSVLAQRPELTGHSFFAAGVSAVFHPCNPNAPSAHCNVRYFEAREPGGAQSAWWFGGGADLTPFYPRLEDVRHFHATLRAACDRHDSNYYPAFKAWCDRYFYLPHRNETRGVGGIFFDYLDANGFDAILAFARDLGDAFVEAYFPIVERRAREPFGEEERNFQLVRRGRYVEFNLVYDRGTHFGLQSGGRTQSILVSMPPLARWTYDERARPGSREAELDAYLRPHDWFAEDPFAE